MSIKDNNSKIFVLQYWVGILSSISSVILINIFLWAYPYIFDSYLKYVPSKILWSIITVLILWCVISYILIRYYIKKLKSLHNKLNEKPEAASYHIDPEPYKKLSDRLRLFK